MVTDAEMEVVNSDKTTVSKDHKRSSYAPWYTIPRQPIVSVEHPFIIKDVDKGLATLGSLRKLQEVSRLGYSRRRCLMFLSSSKRMALPPICI